MTTHNFDQLKINQAAKFVGVSAKTLRRWESRGILSSKRTPGNQRIYDLSELVEFRRHQKKIKSEARKIAQEITSISKIKELDKNLQKNIKGFEVLPAQKLILKGFFVTFTIFATLVALDRLEIIKFADFEKNQGKVASVLLKAREKYGPIIADTAIARMALPKKVDQNIAFSQLNDTSVLAAIDIEDAVFGVSIPGEFAQTLNVIGDLTAPNITYTVSAGDGIEVTGGQNPIVSLAEDAVNGFGTVTVGSTSIEAEGNDELLFAAGSNVSISVDTSTKKLTISSTDTNTGNVSGWTDDGSLVRLSTAGDIVSIGSATGSAKLSVEGAGYAGDILTASQSGNLLLKLTNTGLFNLAATGFSAGLKLQNATTMFSGAGAPSDANGANGDYYFRTDGTGNTSVYTKVAGVWTPAGGATTTLQDAYDNDANGSDTLLTLSSSDDSLIIRNPASGGTDTAYVLGLEQLASGAIDTLNITNSGTGAGINLNAETIVNIGNAGTDFDTSGGLTLAGTFTANGIANIGDGGEAVAISGTTVSLTSNSSGNDITLTSADDIIFDDLQLTSAINLTATDTAFDSGDTAIVDAINTAYGAATGGGGGLWTLSTNVIHPTTTTQDFAIGGTTLAASIFSIDESAGIFLFGGDQSANPTLTFEATDSDTGDFGFNTNDAFFFSGANVGIGDTSPSSLLEVGDGTDSLQISSVGDITFVDADGAATITGPAGGALNITAANSQALALATTTAGNITLTPAGAGDVVIDTDSDTQLILNGGGDGVDSLVLTDGDILVTDGDLDLSGGDFNITLDTGDGALISNAAATADALTATLTGVGSDAIQINLTQSDDGDATDNSAAFRLALTSSSGDADLLYGIDIGNITEGTATEVALRIGSGWTNLIEFEGATDNDFEAFLQITDPTADRTFTLPNASGEICLVAAGNCAGSGTGVTTTGGTANTITKFTGTQAVGDSTITDDGTVVTFSVDADLTLAASENLSLTNTTASSDQVNLAISGVTTSGADGIALAFTQADDLDSSDTNAGINVGITGDSGDADTLVGINIANLAGSSAAATSYALQIGSTWDQNLYFNDTTTNVQLADGGTITIHDGTNTLCTITDSGTTGDLNCSGNITGSSGGTSGFWSRSGTTLSPATANDIVSIANTTTTGADLAITNTGVYTGTGIFNLTANSATTGNIAVLSGTGMTTGEILDLTGTWAPTDGSTNEAIDLNITHTPTTSADNFQAINLTTTDGTALGNTIYNLQGTLTLTGNAAKTGIGDYQIVTSSSTTGDTLVAFDAASTVTGILAGATTRSVYGLRSQPTAGAESGAGTTNLYGVYSKAAGDVAASGTINTYGLYVADGSGDAEGTATNFGLYLEPITGADANYGICFDCDGTYGTSSIATGISWGSDANTVTLYRSASDILRTGDSLTVDLDLIVSGGDITGANSASIDIGEAVSGAITFTAGSAGDFVFDTDSDSTVTLNGGGDGVDSLVLTDGDILVTDGDVDISAGDFNVTLDSGDEVDVTKTAAAAATEEGIDLTFTSGAGDGSDVYSGLRIAATSADHSASTDKLYGINIANLTSADAEGAESAIFVGTGWDDILNYNGTTVIEGDGEIVGAQITDDSLDFTEFQDTLDVDAATDINLGAFALTIDMDSTGDFSIRDGTTDILAFTDSGAITATPTSGQNFGVTTAGTGDITFTTATGEQIFTSSVVTGTTTGSGFVFDATAITSGTGMFVTSDSIQSGKLVDINTLTADTLTTGTLLNVFSESTGLTTGNLASFDWAPSPSATSTGDLVKIHIGPQGDLGTGANLFNILSDTTSLFSVSETAITNSLPTAFNATGDVSIAYDLVFTNQTASYIKSNAPLYLEAGESFENNNLTLRTFGTGDVVFDLTGAGGGVTIDAASTDNTTATGVFAISVDSATTSNTGLYVDYESVSGVADNADLFAQRVFLTQSDTTGDLWGVTVTANAVSTTIGAGNLYECLLCLVNEENQAAAVLSAISINSIGATAGAITNAIHIEDDDVTTDLVLQNDETIDNDTDDFIEFQGVAGTDNTDLRLDLDGTLPVWNSPTDTTIQFDELVIVDLGTTSDEAICGEDGDADTSDVTLRDCSGTPQSDYAEIYPTASDVDYGDVVATGTKVVYAKALDAQQNIDESLPEVPLIEVVKTATAYQKSTIGIASNNYGDFSSVGHNIHDKDHPLPIALNGRVLVKITPTSDAIHPGDFVTTSNDPGKAMKANHPGHMVGKALDTWVPGTGQETVLVFVYNSWADPNGALAFDENGNLIVNTIFESERIAALEDRVLALESENPSTIDFGTMQSEIDLLNAKTDYLQSQIDLIVGNATGSGTLTQTATSSGTFTDILVLGNSVLSDTVINGKLDIGTITIDSIENSINTLGDLNIQPLALGKVDFLGGKIEMDTGGNININEGVIAGNDSFRGNIEIAAGETFVVVDKTGIWDTPPSTIQVTPNYKTQVWVTDITADGFTVNISSTPTTSKEIYWTAIW